MELMEGVYNTHSSPWMYAPIIRMVSSCIVAVYFSQSHKTVFHFETILSSELKWNKFHTHDPQYWLILTSATI